MNYFTSACPLNCWDQCAFLVRVENDSVSEITPHPAQAVTGRFICPKGKEHLARINRSDRLLYPLLKTAAGFKRLSWPEAIATAALKIREALDRFGPLSLLHYYDGGFGGVLKKIESRFFSALGGCTTHRGSLCWGAGLAAQTYDFGAVLSHSLADLLNSQLIVIWGRNPAATARHQLSFIGQARKNGAKVILIDPLQTATCALADEHIPIQPGTDGALALGMAHQIIKDGLTNQAFLHDRCSGFEPFRELAAEYPPEIVSAATGLSPGRIIDLARQYATTRPAAILLGYGLQRYSNSGNAIRAIDALGALTGNIGAPGGGVNYANFQVAPYIDHQFLEGAELSPHRRYYPKPKLGQALGALTDPPLQVAYISRSNPLTQVGNSNSVRQAFARIPFKIVSDMFMTDTAAAADLVLPCTFFLEEEDLYYSSMNHSYLTYGPKIAAPPGECRHEYAVLRLLAKELGAHGFPADSAETLLRRIIRPLTREKGVTLEQLKKAPLLLPGLREIPWNKGPFATADGKFNFYAAGAAKDNISALPEYFPPAEISNRELRDRGFRYWFATPHPADSIHSSHRLPGCSAEPLAYLHPDTGFQEAVCSGDLIKISSPRGAITIKTELDTKVPPGCVLVYEGWWSSSGASVNSLSPDRLTDMGMQAAFYDCLCKIEKAAGGEGI